MLETLKTVLIVLLAALAVVQELRIRELKRKGGGKE